MRIVSIQNSPILSVRFELNDDMAINGLIENRERFLHAQSPSCPITPRLFESLRLLIG